MRCVDGCCIGSKLRAMVDRVGRECAAIEVAGTPRYFEMGVDTMARRCIPIQEGGVQARSHVQIASGCRHGVSQALKAIARRTQACSKTPLSSPVRAKEVLTGATKACSQHSCNRPGSPPYPPSALPCPSSPPTHPQLLQRPRTVPAPAAGETRRAARQRGSRGAGRWRRWREGEAPAGNGGGAPTRARDGGRATMARAAGRRALLGRKPRRERRQHGGAWWL
jgi:hypothetical protein